VQAVALAGHHEIHLREIAVFIFSERGPAAVSLSFFAFPDKSLFQKMLDGFVRLKIALRLFAYGSSFV